MGEVILDYGQDGLENTNDLGENDGLLLFQDSNELDGIFDAGDNCFGCEGENFHDLDNDGIYNPAVDDFIPQIHDANGDGIYTPPDYKDNFTRVLDLDGDGYDEFPDFEVKNSKGEFRLDYDPSSDLNITFQTGYSWSKLQQVTGIGRYLAEGYEYTYYQLRGRYKNWFSQIYLNQGNSGDTRGYDLGNRINKAALKEGLGKRKEQIEDEISSEILGVSPRENVTTIRMMIDDFRTSQNMDQKTREFYLEVLWKKYFDFLNARYE